MESRLILIRHLKWDKVKEMPKGDTKKDIEKIIEKLKPFQINKIYSSPSERCLFLAKEISRILNLPLIIDDLLKERNEGDFSNLENHEELLEKEAKKLGLHYVEYRPPNGESVLDVLDRTRKFLEKIKKEKFETSIIVTHYTNILCFISILNNLDIKEVWDKNIIDPKEGEVIIVKL